MPPDVVADIAGQLRIIHHQTGVLGPWETNAEQRQIWRDLWRWRQVYVLKVRQIGASTAACLFDVLWCSVNDTAGERVRLGIVVDTDVKAQERVNVCLDFCKQLGLSVRYRRGTNTLQFPNGSEIIGMTAGGRRAGASMTFHFFHFTELPFWRDPLSSYTSLKQALVLDGRELIETTMGVEDPLGKDLWVKENDYYKRFFSFEEHEEYRMEPDGGLLTPDMEEYLRSEGFTKPESMTYWVWLLQNRCGADLVRCFREYPQKPEHSWTYAEGRWIAITPRTYDPKESIRVNGATSSCYLDVFKHRDDGSGQYVIGVDTAGGMGRDSSSVAVIDCRDMSLVASFVSPDVMIDDLAEVVLTAQQTYSSVFEHPRFGRQPRVPPVVIEDNGIGKATVQSCRNRGVARTVEHHTNHPLQVDGLGVVKRYVEAGVLHGPEVLAQECDELRTEGGKFVGRKDLCMAISFCYHWLAENPYSPDLIGRDYDRANFLSRLGRS